eukprot:scaffold8912_cov70-Skeletonema_dohrnii-CCMP3373.AAC.1
MRLREKRFFTGSHAPMILASSNIRLMHDARHWLLKKLQLLHTTSYIDKGEASTILLALSLRPLHTTSYIDKDGKMGLLALQPLHTTSYINKGEASIIANREVVFWDRLRKQ